MNHINRFILNVLASNYMTPGSIRIKLYGLVNPNIKAKEIRSRCFFNSKFVSIGEGSFVNYGCQFHSSFISKGYIKIGANCYFGMNVNLCTVSHEIGDENQRAGTDTHQPIEIGHGVWVGANVVVLPNVKIGSGCVIASGSVVSKDCEPNGLYGGVPARRIKDLPIGEDLSKVI